MIRAEGLRCRLGGFSLTIDRLEIASGRYGVLLGPSGSGKTIFLKTLAGLIPTSQGRIYLDGREVSALPPEKRRLGLVFQEVALFPHYRVKGNITYGMRVAKGKRGESERFIGELIESLGLSALLERSVQSLSGGEAQKVALARALAAGPRVLLLDEPLGQVDRDQREEIQTLLKNIQRHLSLTVLHVTHDVEEAAALADVGAVMLGGRLLQCSEWSDLRERPACPFVARFFKLTSKTQAPRPEGCREGCRSAGAACDLGAGVE